MKLKDLHLFNQNYNYKRDIMMQTKKSYCLCYFIAMSVLIYLLRNMTKKFSSSDTKENYVLRMCRSYLALFFVYQDKFSA